MKICSKCGEEKSEEDFHRDRTRKGGLYPWCKTCSLAGKERSRQRNPQRTREVFKAAKRRYKERHPNRVKASGRKQQLRKYGITPEEYDDLLADQSGVCAICKRGDHQVYGLSVDHDHRTGRVRGLLCSNCNTALGLVGESVQVLRKMGEYLLCG